jgi:hypothetical protein
MPARPGRGSAPKEFRSGFGGVIGLVFGAIILVLVGVTAAAPYLNRWRMGKVVYAVTTRRALAWNSNWAGQLTLCTCGPSDMAGRSLRDVWGGPEGVGNTEDDCRKLHKKLLKDEPSMFASHPTFQERMEAAKHLPQAKKTEDKPSLQLFEQPEKVEQELTDYLTTAVNRYIHG